MQELCYAQRQMMILKDLRYQGFMKHFPRWISAQSACLQICSKPFCDSDSTRAGLRGNSYCKPRRFGMNDSCALISKAWMAVEVNQTSSSTVGHIITDILALILSVKRSQVA